MRHVVYCSIPGLRQSDLSQMPALSAVTATGDQQPLSSTFPAVTWPAQATMLTGKTPSEHGVIANGFYWREEQKVEMWTAWNDKIQAPQIWDRLHAISPDLTSAVWFPMLSKGCGADWICMPAPVHNPDGSESLWCYTKPTQLYGELLETLDHFPLKHFWGPLSNIQSTEWIIRSAVQAISKNQPRFSFLYLPHLDYAAQKQGPNSPEALAAVKELDGVIQVLADGVHAVLDPADVTWVFASEYVISEVNHVTYPNRVLRDAGLLQVRVEDDGEHLDLNSSAWALVDHQFSHVFIKDADPTVIQRVKQLFESVDGIAEVLTAEKQAERGLAHERSGELMLVSTSNSWQAYYWWLQDDACPAFARTVDIHRKPGYDPVELYFDMATRSTPLDATLICGSHGVPSADNDQQSVIVSNQPDLLQGRSWCDLDLAEMLIAEVCRED